MGQINIHGSFDLPRKQALRSVRQSKDVSSIGRTVGSYRGAAKLPYKGHCDGVSKKTLAMDLHGELVYK